MRKLAYYDGTKLLSLKDINGNTPELFIVTTNRTGGKTTYFGRLLINRFLRTGAKFALIYRFNYELADVCDKFYSDISQLFFPDHCMSSELKGRGIYSVLKLDNQVCGYAIALNSADNVKKYSHVFNDVECMLMDEFQSETNHYCAKEIDKFLSIHTSVARGKGKQIRYVPVYLLSNTVSLINPYYTALGIADRLQQETKFLKGDGFVLEQGFVPTAAQAMLVSGFNKAFKNNCYIPYAAQNIYLNDNNAFIEKPIGKSRYIGTLKYRGNNYGLREYTDLGMIYCDNSYDATYPNKISVTTDDHNINYVMLKRNDLFISNMRFLFDKGCFRFKNLLCKEAVMKALSY